MKQNQNKRISMFEERKDLETKNKLIFESTEFFLNEISKLEAQFSLLDLEICDEETEIQYNKLCKVLAQLYLRIKFEAYEHDKLNRRLKQLQLKYHGKNKI